LNHTAGLSTPQQIQMGLFALMCLLDKKDAYKKSAKKIVRERYEALFAEAKHAPLIPLDDKNGAFYYVEIDIKRAAIANHSEAFFDWMETNFEPLDFLLRLAEQSSVVVMPGGGFDDAPWSLRVSLANLDKEDYTEITRQGKLILEDYYAEYLEATK
ncbi:MAG: aminotransferase class I/II-fold pyridoxal phosphate-dependent enzyme, partial [Psychromonas sp.]